MNSDRYFDSKTFIEHQIRTLVAPFDLPQANYEEIVDLIRSGHSENTTHDVDLYLERVLGRVNNSKKQHLQRIFTQQATRHVALQILESEASAKARALDQTTTVLDLVQSDSEDEEDEESETELEIEEKLRDRLRVQFSTMSDFQLRSLCQDLLDGSGPDMKPTGGLSEELQHALQRYEISKQRFSLYKRIQESVSDTITTNPRESVQPHLLQSQPDLLNLIGRIRSLSARVSAKASVNPEDTRKLLMALQNDGEEEDTDDLQTETVKPDPKRQKLIINNDPSELLKMVFDANTSQ